MSKAKRPEKKTLHEGKPFNLSREKLTENINYSGYNQCFQEFEEFLPDAEEILNIIMEEIAQTKGNKVFYSDISQAIHKRLTEGDK